MKSNRWAPACAFLWLGMLALPSAAQLVLSDTLNGKSSSLQWQSLNGACLTAGDGSGSIPKCVGLPYYGNTTQVGGVTGRLAPSGDPDGQGALRLTNGDTTTGGNGNNQTGAIYSKFTIDSNQGLEVTFKTVTYGGNGYVNPSGQRSGADGIAFFLVDGDQITSVDATTKTGAVGGSLGYSCANSKGTNDGLLGAYVGLGIDEFGNFSNPVDNTASGPGTGAGRVTLRGAGDITWGWLNRNYPTYYPSTLSASTQQASVGNTCRTGKLYNYSGRTVTDANGNSIGNQQATTEPVLTYPWIASKDLEAGSTIYSQQATAYPTRGRATPITYGLRITQNGLLSLSYSYNGGLTTPIITDKAITDASLNGPLPSKFRFGFSGGTGGGSNVHEIMCFKAAQINSASTSAGINIPQSARVQVGSQLYLAYYHPVNWWGQLTANNLVLDPTTDVVSIAATSNWDASCVLTGGACSATGGTRAVQAPSARQILGWNGAIGVPLTWNGGITPAQKNALDSASLAAASSPRLDYLRGVRTNELTAAGTGSFRVRNSVLGDIVNSSPTWVGAPASPYKGAWKDALAPTTAMPEGATSYAAFAASNATRTNVVYAGANDGLLHGFRAGAYDASGNFNTQAANDGQELIAYMPAAVLGTIRPATAALDYASPQYSHNAYVDATPGTGDLFYGGSWHTWLVGGLGAGGNANGVIGDRTSVATGALYALDVTTPGNFSEANAASLVIGEWNSTSVGLSCPTDTGSSACRDSLGSVYGTPIIRRLHDGNWAVIFGNGLNSKSGKAGIFVMTVNQTSGARSFRFLDTGVGPTTDASNAVTARNGIVHVTSADLDGDHVTDHVYAGDVFGNLWRFDLTSATAGNWAVRPTPLFSTGGAPISTAVAVASTTTASIAPRVIVSFGTGQILPQTLNSAATPAAGTQSIYGIWDWDFAAWNAKGSTLYTSLASPQTVNAGKLQTQTITTVAYASGAISGYRTVTQNPVCWAGSTACSSGNTQFGWQITLPGASEQVVYNPVISDGLLLVNTTLPSVTQTLSCDVQPASGYTMAITPDSGGAPATSYFATATSNVVLAAGQTIAGLGLSATGSPSVVSGNRRRFLITQTTSGTGNATQVDPPRNGSGGRVTWIKWR